MWKAIRVTALTWPQLLWGDFYFKLTTPESQLCSELITLLKAGVQQSPWKAQKPATFSDGLRAKGHLHKNGSVAPCPPPPGSGVSPAVSLLGLLMASVRCLLLQGQEGSAPGGHLQEQTERTTRGVFCI